jgi:alanine racemase
MVDTEDFLSAGGRPLREETREATMTHPLPQPSETAIHEVDASGDPTIPDVTMHSVLAPEEPPGRVLKPRRAMPADAVRPTRAEINLAALRHNLHVVRKHADRAKVWAVLKADGYGHGAPAVARTLERAGADGFCVALLEEGVELREAGITAPILVMGGYYGAAYAELLARHLTPVVYDLGQVEGFAKLARAGEAASPVVVHLKVDTGMARLGVTMSELPAFAAALARFPEVHIGSLMTHLASADAASEDDLTSQMVRFDEATAILARHGVRPRLRHAANSAALLRGHAQLDAVRPGVALFGVSPRLVGAGPGTAGTPLVTGLWPVMRVRTEIIALRDVPVGSPIGYGGLFRTTRPSRIATVPMGYADGLSRQLSSQGQVLLAGERAPIVGAVSMDMAMIDVTDIAKKTPVSVRDEVVVLGPQEGRLGKDLITADEVADQTRTIPWEVLTAVSRRVPRFYREP